MKGKAEHTMGDRRKLSESMLRMLKDLDETGDATASRRGQAEHGGAHGSWMALSRRGLINDKGLTAAGRAVLKKQAEQDADARAGEGAAEAC